MIKGLVHIPGYEGLYLINREGQIFSAKKGSFLNPVMDVKYFQVTLYRGGRPKNYKIHRLMSIAFLGGKPIDHKNRNKLDNRICNLRPATSLQNQGNRGLQVNNTSGIKGVFFEASRNKWKASIGINGTSKTLGRFETAEAAIAAYNVAATERFGDFAYLN